MNKLTNRAVERSKPGVRDKYIADGDGLFLRVTPNGTKTFCFRYTWGEKRRLLSLGPVPLLSLSDARERAAAARKLIFVGKDPLAQAKEANRTNADDRTVTKLIEDWKERYAKKTYKRLDTQLRMVDRDILPVIGAVPLNAITKKHVSQVINRVIDRGAKVKANRVLSLMRTIFGYAAEHGEITDSPVTMTRKGAGGREKPKQRVLTMAELRSFWNAIETHDGFMTWRTKSILRLILLTAQRPGEVAGMEWKHVNLPDRIWCLPAEIVKSDRDHIVDLSNEAVELIRLAETHTRGRRYVFESVREESRPTGTQTLSTAILRMFKEGEFGDMRRFTPHDLRRTAATRMAEISVHAHIVEKILNHRMKGVMAVYNYAEYLPERRQALGSWGRYVADHVGCSPADDLLNAG
ncbi:MAG: tyrosine-type recombinase/integrase [Pseudomonadota bacterium]|nr:tyrosine-type recombinase/integrase [Pseudomonadota bacterium]